MSLPGNTSVFTDQGRDTQLLAAALALAERGWTVIPTVPGTKRAARKWKRFQTTPPTRRDLEQWFGANGTAGGIAVVLGQASGGLVCRDFDDQDAYDRWAYRFPDLAATLPTVETHRGRHVYFRGPLGFEELEDGEYRGDSRHYCLVPPSPHPKGGCYRWAVPLPADELPEIADPVGVGLVPRPILVNTEDTEDSGGYEEEEEGVSESSVSSAPSVLTDPDEETEKAIRETLPTGPGRRHRAVFEFARRLKSMPQYADADPLNLERVVQIWHQQALPVIRTKCFEETLVDFLEGWERIKFVTGAGPIDQLWEEAGDLIVSAPNRSPGFQRLTALCSLLQRRAPGKSFFLACRTVGRLADVIHVAACKRLRLLERQGHLVRVSTGTRASKKANEYRFCEHPKQTDHEGKPQR